MSPINLPGYIFRRLHQAERVEWVSQKEWNIILWLTALWLNNVGNGEDEEMSRELSKGGFPLKIIILCPVYIWWGCKQNLMIRFLFWKDHYASNLREKLKEKWETSSVYDSHISLCIICILGVLKNPDFGAVFQIYWIRIYKGGARKFEMLNVHR